MLNLIDSITHDMDAAEKATKSERAYHCLRIEVAALQLAALLETKYPNAYAQHLVTFLDGAFSLAQELNGD